MRRDDVDADAQTTPCTHTERSISVCPCPCVCVCVYSAGGQGRTDVANFYPGERNKSPGYNANMCGTMLRLGWGMLYRTLRSSSSNDAAGHEMYTEPLTSCVQLVHVNGLSGYLLSSCDLCYMLLRASGRTV